MAADLPLTSLENFNDSDPLAVITSPRSLQACKNEGVLPQELVYKPVEAFHEKHLEPRLVKLRYDFFEAKRRDLLAATVRARKVILSDERRDAGTQNHQQLETIAKMNGLTKSAVLALNSDGLKLERQKLLRAQEHERNWLKNALRNELNQLALLEKHDKALTEEGVQGDAKTAEAARRNKEMNDLRQKEEQRKQAEMEARSKLEKQIAKEEFEKQQLDLKKKQELEMQKQAEAYQRQVRDAEAKRQKEIEKDRKRAEEHARQVARKEQMRAEDLKRTDLMDQQRECFREAMMEKKENRDARIIQSVEKNQQKEMQRRVDFEAKQLADCSREEKLSSKRAIEQEEMAKKSFQLMMRRKCIQEESARKLEERRLAILEQQEDTEIRLMEHDQKKERYLDFKKELDNLRGQNKDINVERQRRREEAARDLIAKEVQKKDERMEWLGSERKRLHQIRRATQGEAYRCREMVKNEIMRQRVASTYDSKALQRRMAEMMGNELFSSKILSGSTSLPSLSANQSVECH